MDQIKNIVSVLSKPSTRWGLHLVMGAIVGILAGISAAALEWVIRTGSDLLVGRFAYLGGGEVLQFNWAILLLPVSGAFIAGLIVYLTCSGDTGHGVDQLTRAFHHRAGKMGLRVPLIKGVGAAIVISSGGSAGPEGPIAAIGAAIGSTLGRFRFITPHERRILLVAGCAAGIGAIFRCPLGGAMFATSILYSEPEFESDSIVTSFVASVIGYTTYMSLFGFEGPFLEGVGTLQFDSPIHLPWYLILGLLCGLTSIFFYYSINIVEKQLVPRSRWPRWLVPALGGLVTGSLACFLPQIMDGRYIFLQNAIDGGLFEGDQAARSWGAWAVFFAGLVVAKCIATGFTIGSGAPGGVLGPSVFIGGAIGAFLGAVGNALFPEVFSEELRQSLIPVGMAGVLAATMRCPIASIVMVTEMTGSYGLLAPLMLVCITSYSVGRRWGLNHEQLRKAADSPVHAVDPIIHLLERWRVAQVMQTSWPLTVTPNTSLSDIVRHIDPGTCPVIAVADNDQLLGIISTTNLSEVISNTGLEQLLVATDIMSHNYATVSPTEDVYSALIKFNRVDYDALPVMDYGKKITWVGMLSRKQVVDRLYEQMGKSYTAVLGEHEGLSAIEQEVVVNQLLVGPSQVHANVQRLFIPIQAVGKSLRESDFRRQFDAQVIAIEQPDGSLQCPPDVDSPLMTKQRLLVIKWEHSDDDKTTHFPMK